RVPVVIYASSKLLESIKKDKTLLQAQNVACLPGIQKNAFIMPDGHQGYGFPIGGVAAFDRTTGIISPGGVGYDINCGVRLLKTDYFEEDIREKRKKILDEIFREVPAGVGRKGQIQLNKRILLDVCRRGAEWAVDNGYGTKEDLLKTEEYGRMKSANPEFLSQRAIDRGAPQLGTLGSGNHFLEIQKVDQIFDPNVGQAFGIHSKNQILIMIHCGSRGLGHQVASDYIRLMEDKFGTKNLPDRELIYAPLLSDLGQKYYKSMSSAVNFAFVNRQMIAHWVRNVFQKIMGSSDGMDQVYDVCHNVAKMELHRIDGEDRRVCVHRKGATRSFGPGRDEIPDVYRSIGQPVIIPGSMGTASYILVGTAEAENLSFGSTAHGAGRLMSRHEALRNFSGEMIKKEMENQGIELMATSWRGVAEEASGAYKNVDDVVKVSHSVGLGRLVARVVPIGVMKG
ncbi:MAG: RtcB family protein, partial [Candidatus Aminicenantes bacterium]|nr:RtcB family protein [Candidatus Aminicenantes bacterium]